MDRSKPFILVIGDKEIIHEVYKPFKYMHPGTLGHRVLNELSEDEMKDKDIKRFVHDNMARGILLRRMETTGLISRVKVGLYTLTGYGLKTKHTLDEDQLWKNEFYDKQMRSIILEAKKNTMYREWIREKRRTEREFYPRGYDK